MVATISGANIDGSDAKQLSEARPEAKYISPQWTPDGDYIVVTKVGTKTELVMHHVEGGSGITLSGSGDDERFWGVGVDAVTRWRTCILPRAGLEARHSSIAGEPLQLGTGDIERLTQGEGGGFRPVLSPDSRYWPMAIGLKRRQDSDCGIYRQVQIAG